MPDEHWDRASAAFARWHGITEATYYRWKAKLGGMDVRDAKKLKQLEEENGKLKHVMANLTLDNLALKGRALEKPGEPAGPATTRQTSTSCCHSGLLRANRETSRAATAPTWPKQTSETMRSNPVWGSGR
jgi:hypothetical protein